MSLWTGDFGDQYTARNTADTLDMRRSMWGCIFDSMPLLGVNSVLEVGANVGLNLRAINDLVPHAKLYATEPNDSARTVLSERLNFGRVYPNLADDLPWPDSHFDLVFTSGVLIHIPPDKLQASLKEINRVASKYVICGEYFAPSEEMIPYRGHDNALWRRDYGSLFMDACPDLHPIGTLFAWKRTTGLDNLTFWIFEKGPMRN